MYPTLLFKLKASRFGPSKSRCPIIFAPPVSRSASPFLKPTWATDFSQLSVLQLPQEEDSLSSPETTSSTEEDLQTVEVWIQARKNFRSQLESLGDVEKWLSHKPSLSKIEERYWQRIKAGRAESSAAVKPAESESLDVSTAVHGK